MERTRPLEELYLGTCSWNYDSWVGLVYSRASPTAAGYLPEYAARYRSAEIDSWFYRMPEGRDVAEYGAAVGGGFRFTCKVPEEISLTHHRPKVRSAPLVANEGFLSTGRFAEFLGRIEPLLPRIGAIMLEFEYLNRGKMPSLGRFLAAIEAFVSQVPAGLPLALEPRNANYLVEEYFAFMKEKGLIHVFSEKLYLPSAAALYERFGSALGETAVLRLLGGDRKAMEERAGGRWDRIVEENPGKEGIARMVVDLLRKGKRVYINVNNHYEGSAPLTIASLEAMIGGLA
jgi:uncharacterized protein YecE (DUF72 family)